MKKFRLVFIAVMSMAGLSRPAGAQDRRLIAKLSSEIQTVVAAVEREGCYPSREQLNSVIKISGIKFSDVTRLQEGQEIYMSGTCMQSSPTLGTQKISKANKEQAHKKIVATPIAPSNIPQPAVVDSTSLKEVKRLNQVLSDTAAKLIHQIEEVKKSSSTVGVLKVVLVGATAFMFGVLCVLLFQMYQSRQKVFRPRHGTTVPRHQIDSNPNPTP